MAKSPVKLDANGYRKFGMRDKLAYAAGDLGCNMSFALKGTVQTFWLVYMMLETGLLSALLLLVQIWDAVNDPIIGALVDSRKDNGKGKFIPWIRAFAIPMAVVCVLGFYDTSNWAYSVRLIYAFVSYVVYEIINKIGSEVECVNFKKVNIENVNFRAPPFCC